MKLMGLMLLSLVLVGCKDFSGTLDVYKDFNVYDDKKKETVVLPAGVHDSKISVISRDKIRIKSKSINRKGVTIDLGEENLNQLKNPNFNLSAEQIGQEFGMAGNTMSNVVDSGPQSGRDSCTYYAQVRRCRRVCNQQGQCRRVCRWVTQPVSGWQYVEYFVRTKTDSIDVDFLIAGETVGNFVGSHSESARIVTFRGQCGRY